MQASRHAQLRWRFLLGRHENVGCRDGDGPGQADAWGRVQIESTAYKSERRPNTDPSDHTLG